MGSVVLQQSESSLLKDNSNNNNQQQYHSDQENLFMMIGKISRDNHHHSLEQQLLSTSSTAFERGDYSHQHDNIIDEAIVQDEGHQEFNYCDRTLLQQQSHLQLEEQQYDHEPTYENQTDDDVETLFLGSSSCEGSSTAIIIDKARKNNNTIRRILPPQTTFLEKESKLILLTTLTTIDTNNIINYYHQQEYNDNRKQQALGMNERSNIENNAQSLVDQQQQEQQACEQEKQNTTLRKTCNEEILIHNSNDSIIIRSYNYETDEKQVNKIFVEGIKSIVPTYLQTFYLFIHHFGIIQVFAILSLFYISSFIFQFGIIKLLFNPDDSSTTINNHTSLLSIILSFTNLSASSTIYALISTFITCTSMVVLLVCGLSKYVDYSARSYIYQQFKFSDMSNIQKFYIWDEDNHFWVAQLKSTGEIVGTIGVRKRANQEETVELKRMSVSSSMKRKGIASLMLNHLVKWSKEKGYKTIVLSTSSLQAAAVDFYKKNGFSIVKMRRYSRFLPTAHLTFEKHL